MLVGSSILQEKPQVDSSTFCKPCTYNVVMCYVWNLSTLSHCRIILNDEFPRFNQDSSQEPRSRESTALRLSVEP